MAAHHASVCVRTAIFMRVGGTLFSSFADRGSNCVCDRNRRAFCLVFPTKTRLSGPVVRWSGVCTDKDREEDLSASGAKELEQIAALDREDKTAAQAAWISETAAAAERCLPAKKDDTACALLGDLLLRRTGYAAPDENLVTQYNQAAQKAIDMAGRIVPAPQQDTERTTVLAESEKIWYAQLRFSSVRFEPMKQGMGAWVILDITRQPASDEGTCAKKENLSAGALDGWIRARVRFDGEDVAMGTLLLPPGGLAFGTKVTLRAPVLFASSV